MKIQLDWLKTYIDHGLSVQKLSDLLTMGGLEIEGRESVDLGGGRTTEVIELNVTPNRGYCLSHIGVAREVGAMIHKTCTLPAPDKQLAKAMGATPVKKKITVVNEEPELCPRYTAMVIENVKPGSSPKWLTDRLKAVGLRPINNIVDITNFVMMEYGQPLHAFDGALLAGSKIVIRRARKGEPFTALDGTELKLGTDALVIADAEKPVALAGIMGGTHSQVDESTRTVVLESAAFDPVVVRKASKKYGLRSDSSYRFERRVDIEAVATASSRAALLIQELAGGDICKGRIDLHKKKKAVRFDFRISRTNQVLGTNLGARKILKFLKGLGVTIVKEKKAGECYQVEAPPSRPMLTREIDLIEEVARLDGYGEVEVSHPVASVSPVRFTALQTTVRQSKEVLCTLGYSEAINYSFIEEELAQYFLKTWGDNTSKMIQLDNPISSEMDTMRPSLLPGLIKSAAHNLLRRQKSVQLFEQGHIFFNKKGKGSQEIACLAALASGPYPNSVWKDNSKSFDFYDLKGALESLANHFQVDLEHRPANRVFLDTGRQAVDVFAKGKPVGYLGRLMPILSDRWALNPNTFVFELNMEALAAALPERTRFQPIPKFPETFRDISILVNRTVKAQRVSDLIRKVSGPLIQRVELYDHFEGKRLPEGKKSLTFALSFQSSEKTLTDAEVNPIFEKIVDSLSEQLGAALRE